MQKISPVITACFIVYFFKLEPSLRLLLKSAFVILITSIILKGTFRMKHVITVLNISTDLTQCGLIWGLRTDHFIMKLINLLISKLDNCSLGGDFRVMRHAEICQFDRFSLEINFTRACGCNYEIPRLGQVKKIYYKCRKVIKRGKQVYSKVTNT